MPQGLLSDIDDQILQEVLTLAEQESSHGKAGKPDQAFSDYIKQLVRYATGEDKMWTKPACLLFKAQEAWQNGAARAPGQSNISLRITDADNISGRRLVLDITTDDKPFLVDSVSAALSDAGKHLSFFSNAVVDVARNKKGERTNSETNTVRESIIHAEMDPSVEADEIETLTDELNRILKDVSSAVGDWEPMRSRLAACISQLEKSRIPDLTPEKQKEAIEFLKWLWDNRFAFLGVRRFSYEKTKDDITFIHESHDDLGILRDPTRRILNLTVQPDGELPPAVKSFLSGNEPVIIAKSNTKSLIHRRVYMDYVGVKMYSDNGEIIGEERFVGLFTAEAYNRPARDIPLIRSKVNDVLDQTAFTQGGYNEKALINILDTFPRDELFHIEHDTLKETSLGILRLYKRPRVKLFLHRDRFDRFISALVFVPRDRFNSDVREQVGDILCQAYDGQLLSFSPFFGDAALVRIHFIIGIDQHAPDGPSITDLTREIRQICRDWSDELLDTIRARHEGAAPDDLFTNYNRAFSEGYKEQTSLNGTLADIAMLEQLDEEGIKLRVFRLHGDSTDVVRIKIYVQGAPIPLSRLIPTIENLGLNVLRESSFKVTPRDAAQEQQYWIHDFYTDQNKNLPIDIDEVKKDVEFVISSVVSGDTEDDGFNGLVLTAGITWREAWVLRTAAKHHTQSGFQYSQAYVEEALSKNPDLVRDLITFFHARFNPDGPQDLSTRLKETDLVRKRIQEKLATVESLDEDRILRRFLDLFLATTRTNYYQRMQDGSLKPYISFKIDSQQLPDLPEPRPYREIFMSGPRVDGVHLRFGPVARGGLRWSDRREDFRTEVLGLVKAQKVKNAVIVPNGSKGGFYPKRLTDLEDRAAIFEEGREAYKLFISSLLDLTDNIVRGKTIAPTNIVSWDEPDPYLVVAADKGTATFSDTANAISEDYGFWLGDAFASGGSVGYDHKAMGITARGGWEAVKRHFRESGKDIQTTPFTVIGVGDMSGDVFGNGMLLSEHIQLVGAFDHRDIFIDPNPDPATSYKERARLFKMGRSSWQDYETALISKGGGVFSRSSKSIKLSPEIREALAIDTETLTPNQLISAILKAPAELLWFGGIGTYIKSKTEDNSRVGDRANDAVRINARDVQAKVIGEGANLGITQLARIEFSRQGGKINTDAIDNAAGVDSSDHEVNIKILLAAAIEKGEMKTAERNDFLATMTDDVAAHVLEHNYEQTRALTQLTASAADDIDIHARVMTTLEREGRLDRAIEFLPDAEQIAQLRQQGLGLSRPELAVLMAYAKMWLFDEITQSTAPDDLLLERELFAYFPAASRKFQSAVLSHRLRREIIATRLANEIIDTCGLNFIQRVTETPGITFCAAALAYEAVRRIYDLQIFASNVNELDNKAPASLQTELYRAASGLLTEQVFDLLADKPVQEALLNNGLKPVITRYEAPVAEFKKALPTLLPTAGRKALQERKQHWVDQGAPDHIAHDAAIIPGLEFALTIVDLAGETGWSNPGVGGLFFAIGRNLDFEALRERIRNEAISDHFDKVALRQMVDELGVRQRDLTKRIILLAGEEPKGDPATWVEDVITQWRNQDKDCIAMFERASTELDLSGTVSVGKLALYNRKLDLLTG